MARMNDLSQCTIRIIVGFLLTLCIGGGVCTVIGVAILVNNNDKHDNKVKFYDDDVRQFVNGFALTNMQASRGLVQPEVNSTAKRHDDPTPVLPSTETPTSNETTVANTTGGGNETTTTAAASASPPSPSSGDDGVGNSTDEVEVKLLPDPSEQPLPLFVAPLPAGPGLVDFAISVPLSSNKTVGSIGVDRRRFSVSTDKVTSTNGGAAAQVAMSVRAAAIAAVAGAQPAQSTAESGAIMMPDVVVTLTDSAGIQSNITLPAILSPQQAQSSARCSHGKDSACTMETMTKMCQQQTGCSNALYLGKPCPPGKPCTGCSYLVYQSTQCLVLSHSNKTGFSLSSRARSCLYPFKPQNQPVACSSNAADKDYVHILLFDERDPFLRAQNETHGTMIFPGYTQASQALIGIALTAGGAGLLLLSIGIWYVMKLTMRDDNPSKRHFYGAFGQTYIPTPRDMAESVQAGTANKYNNGFAGKSGNGNSSSGPAPKPVQKVAAGADSRSVASAASNRSGDAENPLEVQLVNVGPSSAPASPVTSSQQEESNKRFKVLETL